MALTVLGVDVDGFDASILDQDDFIVWAAAANGNRAAIRQVMRRAQVIKARAKTTDNTAASEVIDLTTRGVTFPAGSKRKIRFKSTAVTDNDTWVQEWEQYVEGNDGTTPRLVGSPELIKADGMINGTASKYGRVHISATVATTAITEVAAQTSAGSSIAASSSGVAVLTHPVARATVGAKLVSAQFSADVSTIGEQRHVQVETGVSSTTAELSLSTTNGTEAVSDATDVGQLEVELFILPPPSIALVMTSNNLEVHCGHDATDDVYHHIEVEIGPAEFAALVAD